MNLLSICIPLCRLSAKYSPTQVQRSADVAIQGGNEQAKKSSLDAAAETVMNSDE